jgi:hypothetical protein
MLIRSIIFLAALVILALGGVHSKSSSRGGKKLYELLSNLNIVDFIDNGWIELNPAYTDHRVDKYIVKCDASFVVNSNVSFVRKQQQQSSHHSSKSKNKYSKDVKNGDGGGEKSNVEWTPVNDYQIKSVPLCASKCRVLLKFPSEF